MQRTSGRIICWYLPSKEAFALAAAAPRSFPISRLIFQDKCALSSDFLDRTRRGFGQKSAALEGPSSSEAMEADLTILRRMEAGHSQAQNDNTHIMPCERSLK
jgi:hypothetical protein